jgi:NAD(P)-dependent dehydrogenase (short-subunit alcohol dehydrogenase family)
LGEFGDSSNILENELEASFRINVIGLINTINAFIPLIQASSIKKIIAMTSGMGDCEFVNESVIDGGAPYAISKAGVNMVVAKYDATYKSDGVLVMGVCAGSVNTHPANACELRCCRNAERMNLLTPNL